VSTSRLETLSDGVYAIAATLLILDVQVSGSPLGHELLRIWPSYVAYAVSFLTIGIIWANQHSMFTQIDRVDRAFLMINIVFLMVVAFLPFSTRIVADHALDNGAKAAALTYGITLSITGALAAGQWFYASTRHRLLRTDADPRTVAGISRSWVVGPLTYPIATLVALASPSASLLLYGGITVFYVFEGSLFGRATGAN
jgi:uncharacterized membrane protein